MIVGEMTSPLLTAPPFASNGLPPDEVIDALIAGVVPVYRRVEIYESDGTTPFAIEDWNARLVAGNVTVDGTRDERRMCEFELQNDDFALELNPINGFWYDKILKAFWGIEYYSGFDLYQWEMQVGEFMIDRISGDYFPHVAKVTGRDYTKKCIISGLVNSMIFGKGTPIENIIKALAVNAGIKKLRIPFIGVGYDDDVVFEPGTPRWEVMKKLADSIGYEIYFTGDGYLTMRPYQDPVTSPLTWIFRTGKLDGTLVTYARSTNDSRVKNHTVVVGSSQADSSNFVSVAFAEIRNDDPNSPTNIQRIGDRLDLYKSEYITTNEQAAAVAEARHRVSSLEEWSIDFSSVILPWLEGNDIVDITSDNESEYVPARFLLGNYTLPMALGPMIGLGRRVTIVGTTRTSGA